MNEDASFLRRARRLWAHHFARYFLIGLAMWVLSLIPTGMAYLYDALEPTRSIMIDGVRIFVLPRFSTVTTQFIRLGITTLGTLLISPVVSMGFANVSLRVWGGEKPMLRDLFAYMKPRYYFKSLIMEFCADTIMLLPLVLIILMPSPWQKIIGLLLLLLGIYPRFRLFLVEYSFARQPDAKIRDLLSESWRMMRGYCMNAFILGLCLIWVPLAAVPFTVFANFVDAPVAAMALRGIASLIIQTLNGCVMLTYAGFYQSIRQDLCLDDSDSAGSEQDDQAFKELSPPTDPRM